MFTHVSFKSFLQHDFFGRKMAKTPLPWSGTGVSRYPWATTMRWWKLWSLWPIWRRWWCWNRWSVSLRSVSPKNWQFRLPSDFTSWIQPSLVWSYKAGPNFSGPNFSIPTGAISFGRVKGAQKLSEGWMDVDGWEVQMRHPVLFSGFKLFHKINSMSLFCIKWLLKTLFTQDFQDIYIYMICYSRTAGLDWLRAWMTMDTACTIM